MNHASLTSQATSNQSPEPSPAWTANNTPDPSRRSINPKPKQSHLSSHPPSLTSTACLTASTGSAPTTTSTEIKARSKPCTATTWPEQSANYKTSLTNSTKENLMFISDTIKSEVITVTPRLAKQLLEQNTGNRKISAVNLERVKASMTRNEWVMNGEAIKIAQSGKILDGQHRLQAAVDTDTTFPTLIVYGLDNIAQDTMDTGKRRTLADVLQIAGYKNTTNLASIVQSIIRSERHSIRHATTNSATKYPVTNRQAIDRLEREPSLEDLPGIVRGTTKYGMTVRVAGLLFYVFSKIDAEDAQDFFEKFESGAGLERGNPILTLRNQLLTMKQEARGAVNPSYMAALIIKAWNKYRDGESAHMLKFRVGGANPERFPEPH